MVSRSAVMLSRSFGFLRNCRASFLSLLLSFAAPFFFYIGVSFRRLEVFGVNEQLFQIFADNLFICSKEISKAAGKIGPGSSLKAVW